jgi:hypothetical protein
MIKGTSRLLGLYAPFGVAVRELLQQLDDLALQPIVTEGHRTYERQRELYAQGRTAPGAIVTQALPGESAHNFGLACDITTEYGYNSVQQKDIQRVARSLGFGTVTWDLPHVQHPSWWLILKQLRSFKTR